MLDGLKNYLEAEKEYVWRGKTTRKNEGKWLALGVKTQNY